MSTPDPTDQIGDRAFQQFMELFVLPVVKERQANNALPTPLDLRAAQIIFFPDGKPVLVRLNEEVKAEASMKVREPIKAGDLVYEHQVEEIADIKLHGDEFADCGHVTMIRLRENWIMRFDFRYNRALANTHIDRATEFHATARFALESGRRGAFVDNLFSAGELAAKAVLLGAPDPRFRERANHKLIRSRFNHFAHLGNVDAGHRTAFNRLDDLRRRGRYLQGELQLPEDEAKDMLASIGELIAEAARRAQ